MMPLIQLSLEAPANTSEGEKPFYFHSYRPAVNTVKRQAIDQSLSVLSIYLEQII